MDLEIDLLPLNHSYLPELLEEIVDGKKELKEICHRCGCDKKLHIREIISFDGDHRIIR